jgi:hypothetical protein
VAVLSTLSQRLVSLLYAALLRRRFYYCTLLIIEEMVSFFVVLLPARQVQEKLDLFLFSKDCIGFSRSAFCNRIYALVGIDDLHRFEIVRVAVDWEDTF